MKIDRRNLRHWLLLAQQAAFTLMAIAIRPVTSKPAKPVVLLYGHQLSGNLKALYEEWQSLFEQDFDLFFLSLDPDYSSQLTRQDIRVARCNRLGDMLLLSKASAMITDHGLHAMQPLLRLTDIQFIDVWHGIPFKGFVPDDFRLQHRYDEVWVSSPLLAELYTQKFGFDPARVKSLGYARTDRLFRESGSSKAEPRQSRKKKVMFAPTWQQDVAGRPLFPFDLEPNRFVEELVQVCARYDATLVIRSHLNANIPEEGIGNVEYCPQRTHPDTEALLLEADILICDWSSIAFDYLALHRPTIFLEVEPPFKNGFSLGGEYRFGKIAGDMTSLKQILENALTKPDDYMAEQKIAYDRVAEAVYGENQDGRSAHRQMERLKLLVQQ